MENLLQLKFYLLQKEKKESHGKIQGSISDQVKIGTIYKNTKLGVYGTITDLDLAKINLNNEVEVASRQEIELGKASIICSLDEEKPKEYEIQIEKIFFNNDDNKGMLIKVVDEELIKKTGGIIQGMSGCPIIQNGKFIGAVTNVLINDPTKGYAIFGDLMLKEICIKD